MYGDLVKKYSLPNFGALNLDFEVEKLDKDTDHILRAFRKIMMEKVVNSMGFLEMLVNPINAPRMYLPFIRTMTVDDKKIIDSLYMRMAELSLLSLDLEVESSEKREALLLSQVFNAWQKIKPDFKKLLASMKVIRGIVKKELSYFG